MEKQNDRGGCAKYDRKPSGKAHASRGNEKRAYSGWQGRVKGEERRCGGVDRKRKKVL